MIHHKHIRSADNPQFKQLKKLAGSARERRSSGQTLLDGTHLLQALADSGGIPSQLIVREGGEQDIEISALLQRFAATPVLLLSPALFDAISPVEHPVGILGLLSVVSHEARHYDSAVLLENIQDPGNLGSILRTCGAAGIEAVFLSKGCAEAWSPKAMRAGMGAHFALDIHEQQALPTIAQQFESVIATRLDASQLLYETALDGSIAFVFGNEGAGLSAELSACATHNIKIPMPGPVESLNVAAAVAVCLFERVRQRS